MSGEAGEFGVSDHFREVTKMIVPGSGSTGKSGTICRIPDSSDLKSPIRCTGQKSALCTLRKRERPRRTAPSYSEPRTPCTVYRSAEGWNSFAWEEKTLRFGKDWICLRFSGISTGHLFPIFIKIKHFARNRLSLGFSVFSSINLAPELLQWCINIIKYTLKYQGVCIPRSFFLSWRKILLI